MSYFEFKFHDSTILKKKQKTKQKQNKTKQNKKKIMPHKVQNIFSG